ncbi:unnamed protein product [Cochlearia groenlandica]
MKRSLEIELISGEELKVDRKPLKRKTFCIVRIDQKTKKCELDKSGGSFPIWKEKIDMDISINGNVRFIFIEVYYRTSNGSDKNLGVAKIPVNDFMGGLTPCGHVSFLSYRLRDEYGDKCGIINVSIMVKPDGADGGGGGRLLEPSCCSAAASGGGHMWSGSSIMGGRRMVTGVPVWCAYQRPS